MDLRTALEPSTKAPSNESWSAFRDNLAIKRAVTSKSAKRSGITTTLPAKPVPTKNTPNLSVPRTLASSTTSTHDELLAKAAARRLRVSDCDVTQTAQLTVESFPNSRPCSVPGPLEPRPSRTSIGSLSHDELLVKALARCKVTQRASTVTAQSTPTIVASFSGRSTLTEDAAPESTLGQGGGVNGQK